MKDLKKYKWRIYWAVFLLLIGFLVIVTISFEDRPWIGNAIQTLGIIAGLYATILIYTQSREEGDRQAQKHLEHLQSLNTKEIETLKDGTEKQISTIQESTQTQITALQELTERQVAALHKSTERQIDAIQKATFEQINSFEKQTTEIAAKLADNSILLAEILGREFEKAISQTTAVMEQAERDYLKLSGFQIGRTPQEKAIQLEQQRGRIGLIKQWIDNWSAKYNRLKGYFGFNDKLLKG